MIHMVNKVEYAVPFRQSLHGSGKQRRNKGSKNCTASRRMKLVLPESGKYKNKIKKLLQFQYYLHYY